MALASFGPVFATAAGAAATKVMHSVATNPLIYEVFDKPTAWDAYIIERAFLCKRDMTAVRKLSSKMNHVGVSLEVVGGRHAASRGKADDRLKLIVHNTLQTGVAVELYDEAGWNVVRELEVVGEHTVADVRRYGSHKMGKALGNAVNYCLSALCIGTVDIGRCNDPIGVAEAERKRMHSDLGLPPHQPTATGIETGLKKTAGASGSSSRSASARARSAGRLDTLRGSSTRNSIAQSSDSGTSGLLQLQPPQRQSSQILDTTLASRIPDFCPSECGPARMSVSRNTMHSRAPTALRTNADRVHHSLAGDIPNKQEGILVPIINRKSQVR